MKVRTRLFKETARRLERQGAVVWRVEAAFGRRRCEVTHPWGLYHVQTRTSDDAWNKEALINLGAREIFRRVPGATYVAWVDADVEFVRPDWVAETVHQLQHHEVVQLWSNAVDLNPRYDFMGRSYGFAKLWSEGQRPGDFEQKRHKYPSHMHPGYGWAWRREAWEACGGMITTGVLGSGDHHMACALVGHARQSVWQGLHPGYAAPIVAWGARATAAVNGNVGYVEGLLLHHFHGYKEHRGYKTRVDVLREHQFDPSVDLEFDDDGMPHLTGNKPALRDDVRRYMASRKEYDLAHALESETRLSCWERFQRWLDKPLF